MNMRCKLLISAAYFTLLSGYSYAMVNVGTPVHHKPTHSVMTNGCTQDLGSAIFNVNNVRCRIMDEGDMWWNPGTACPVYIIPANGDVNAQFAASLWIGGYDAGNQLKEAAMTYRQNGEDFWAGPIDTVTSSISVSECQTWDKLFYCTQAEVQLWHASNPHGGPNPPTDIKNWPGSGNAGYNESQFLAPYVNISGEGSYDPYRGDYPAFDLTGNGNCQNELYGDACLWWVINDVGNIHTETGSVPIGLEIRCEAFGYKTNDAINNMTFYHYQIVNRSTFTLYKTYFGFWDDFDLGNGADNFTGCDVGRKMGYGYSASAKDANGTGQYACEPGYLSDPAAVGVVFFQGPKADKNDTNCYVKNGLLGMARFCYYNNDFSNQGNPTNQTSYYNYLTGFWIDGTAMTYGGNGYGGTVPCHYMFPWTPAGAAGGSGTATNTDPTGCGTGRVVQSKEWDEVNSADNKGDRRFIESSGPFTLQPGAVNYVIVGCVWDQPATSNLGNTYPIGLIQQDADLAQGLFDNCFKVVNGPDAPDVTTQALNQEIILTLTNSPTSNNHDEHYQEKDPTIPTHIPGDTTYMKDSDYKFQGYEIFQLLDSAVTSSELLDPTKARLVAQCDVKDTVSQIINYVYNSGLNASVPTAEVSGANKGIVHSFDIKSDAFQQDNQSYLVNDRPYYYMAIAYAYNNYLPYMPNGPITNITFGQKLPFLQGRRNIKVYTVYPTMVNAQNGGTIQNSVYGSGVSVTRIEGHGNGANTIELDQNSINYILANDTMAHPTYLPGQGPIDVKIVDPLNVVNANFIVKFIPGSQGVSNSVKWQLINQTTGEVDNSDTTIGYQNEQIFPQYGISITIANVHYPGGGYNGVIDSASNLTFANPTQNWLSYVASVSPSVNPAYWIRSGTSQAPAPVQNPQGAFDSYDAPSNYDPNEFYNQIVGGSWAPYSLCAVSDRSEFCDNGPAYAPLANPGNAQLNNPGVIDSIGNIASVDVVFTADRSKWTRCIVLEEQDQTSLAQGGAQKLNPRMSFSIDQDGKFANASMTPEYTDPTLPNYISETSMGWFPGYTINLETGERLNMAYGEDSWLSGDNGRDMKWNPDSIIYSSGGSSGAGTVFGVTSVFGGKHYIYVFGHNNNVIASKGIDISVPAYDAGKTIHSLYFNQVLTGSNQTLVKERLLNDVMWVNIPLLNRGHQLFECDATVRLRVQKPYDTAYGETYLNGGNVATTHAGSTWRNQTPDNKNFPMYSFSTNGLQAVINDNTTAKNALSLINIVPNPYYAYSGYETTALDTRVRITNLPPVCTISIFTLSGTLINVIQKNSPETYVDWALMNQYNVPIASGLYLVHIAVPNVGEVTLKWFGVMRPLDLTSY